MAVTSRRYWQGDVLCRVAAKLYRSLMCPAREGHSTLRTRGGRVDNLNPVQILH